MKPLSLLLALGLLAVAPAAAQPLPAADDTAETRVLAELTRQLTAQLRLRGELQLDYARSWTAPAAAPLEIDILNAPSRLAPTLLLNIRLRGPAGPLGTHTLTLRARHLTDVYVARTPLDRGTDFDPAALDQRRVDILQETNALAAEAAAEADLTYAVSVPAGRMLTWRDVTRRALIRKGQVIEVTAVDGLLTVTTKALALENGAIGDTVKLRNLESKKDFTALVVANARAQVRF